MLRSTSTPPKKWRTLKCSFRTLYTALEMPGFNVALNTPPEASVIGQSISGFPNALDVNHYEYGCMSDLTVYREILMMRVMNTITDKPDWHRKVFDDTITSKWRHEVAQNGQDVTPKMMNWIIEELKWKAGTYEENNFLRVFDVGVVKSDTAISEQLQQRLREAVIPLENVPEDAKDYHPGSDQKVVDLVHPSLFPVIYGRTRVLADRVIGLDDCIESMGQGHVVPMPSDADVDVEIDTPRQRYRDPSALPPFSKRFQWLPCDVELAEDSSCRIISYINNAHPVRHRALYSAVEDILTKVVPLWNQCLTTIPYGQERIKFKEVEYEEISEPGPQYPEDPGEDFDEEAYFERHEELRSSRPVLRPEPGKFEPPKEDSWKVVDLQKQFPSGRLQVIVKLANIELTPEKPDYEGGSWHIEGQLNERICATAIYYFDNHNITASSLGFRQRGMSDMYGIDYEQDQHQFLQVVYGFNKDVDGHNDCHITQELGGVLCKEGRLITFPNTLQHRVSPFSLADRSKPGHRKILALFLVDPHRRIISSANVPPQREDWAPEQSTQQDRVSETDKISLMTMEEAKEHRMTIMEERGHRGKQQNQTFEIGAFSLCEH